LLHEPYLGGYAVSTLPSAQLLRRRSRFLLSHRSLRFCLRRRAPLTKECCVCLLDLPDLLLVYPWAPAHRCFCADALAAQIDAAHAHVPARRLNT
jgi:hypothetical protein